MQPQDLFFCRHEGCDISIFKMSLVSSVWKRGDEYYAYSRFPDLSKIEMEIGGEHDAVRIFLQTEMD